MQATLLAHGAQAESGTVDEFAAFLNSESSKMKEVIALTGMRAE